MKKILAMISAISLICGAFSSVPISISADTDDLTVIDVIKTKQVLMGGKDDYPNYDVDYNRDGTVNYVDLLYCKKSVLNVADTQPIAPTEFTYITNIRQSEGTYIYKNSKFLVTSYDELVALENDTPILSESSKYHLYDTYNEEYFQDNVLCIANVRRDSGSYGISVDSVTNENGIITLNAIISIEEGGTYTCDVNQDIITVEIPKSCYSGETFEVNIQERTFKRMKYTTDIITGDYSIMDSSYTVKSYDELVALEKETQFLYDGKLSDTYTEEYFQDNILHIQGIYSPSGSYNVEVKSVINSKGVITLNTNMLIPSDIDVTDDIKEYLILLSIPQTQYNDETFEHIMTEKYVEIARIG